MKLRISHVFACTPDEYVEMICDPAFDDMISRESKVDREVLQLEDDGNVRHKVVRVFPKLDVPGILKPYLGKNGLVYDQVSTLDRSKRELSWAIEMPSFADRLSIGGMTWIKDHPDGCVRELDGDVSVRVRLVGGRIEKQIVAEVEKAYVKGAAGARRWIAGDRG